MSAEARFEDPTTVPIPEAQTVDDDKTDTKPARSSHLPQRGLEFSVTVLQAVARTDCKATFSIFHQ